MKHFKEVYDAIWDARVQYQNIGIELGVQPDTIDAIADTQRGNVDKCFGEVLKLSLKDGISQKRIADALQSRMVGYGNLGQEFLAIKFVTPKTGKSFEKSQFYNSNYASQVQLTVIQFS